MNLRVKFLLLLIVFTSFKVKAQVLCGFSTFSPDELFQTSSITNYTSTNLSWRFQVCENAVVYDTSHNGLAVRMVLLMPNSYYELKTTINTAQCQIFANSGSTFVLNPGSVNAQSVQVSLEPNSYFINPANFSVMSGTCSNISYPAFLDTLCTNSTLSIKGVSSEFFDVNIVPNPNDGNFKINIENTLIGSGFNLYLYDSFGKSINYVSNVILNEYQFNLPDIPPGFYILRITNGEKNLVKRISIVK